MRVLPLALLLLAAVPARAAERAPVRITVSPAAIELTGSRDWQGIAVQAEFTDGSTKDVTAAAELTLDWPVARVVNGYLAPAADGSATLTVKHAGQSAAVPVTVA